MDTLSWRDSNPHLTLRKKVALGTPSQIVILVLCSEKIAFIRTPLTAMKKLYKDFCPIANGEKSLFFHQQSALIMAGINAKFRSHYSGKRRKRSAGVNDYGLCYQFTVSIISKKLQSDFHIFTWDASL